MHAQNLTNNVNVIKSLKTYKHTQLAVEGVEERPENPHHHKHLQTTARIKTQDKKLIRAHVKRNGITTSKPLGREIKITPSR